MRARLDNTSMLQHDNARCSLHRRQPVRKRLLKTLMTAGFSPALGRALVNRVPADLDEVQA